MKILFPLQTNDGQTWQQQILSLANETSLSPFDPVLCDFVHTVSQALLSSPEIRPYPELVALAYWMRKTHIRQIMQDYQNHYQHSIPLPRGVVFHIAPTNVDSIFMYSWFLSLLTGNSNIIRLSPHARQQRKQLLNILNDIVEGPVFAPIRQRNIIASYGHESKITKMLSSNCQARVIWGGDETIRRIRAIDLPPQAIEIPFANKFSYCALQAQKVRTAPDEELKTLVENFFNDAFWFQQNACSSPRLVVWVGNQKDITLAKHRFWKELKTVINQKNLSWNASLRINRLVTGYSLAAQKIADSMSSDTAELPYRVHIKKMTPELRQQHPGCGIFWETDINILDELLPTVSLKDQTLTVYGFSRHKLHDFAVKLRNRGLNRIVPVGQALLFQPVWDGVNLLTAFSRECSMNE